MQVCWLVFNSAERIFNSDIEKRIFEGLGLYFRMRKFRVTQSQLSDKTCYEGKLKWAQVQSLHKQLCLKSLASACSFITWYLLLEETLALQLPSQLFCIWFVSLLDKGTPFIKTMTPTYKLTSHPGLQPLLQPYLSSLGLSDPWSSLQTSS